jgi:Mlc titration factor MtfA (ptsG expression regulator)
VALLPRSRRPRPTRDELVPLIGRWLAAWPSLTFTERDRLVDLSEVLVHELRWEAAREFEITDDMRAAIASHAALLVLGFDDGLDSYLDVTSVIVHPSTIVRSGTRYVGGGLFTADEDFLIGEAHHQGPVLVAWDAAAQQAMQPTFGDNVLFHEFAHRLDMLDGISDGTPPLADPDELWAWAEVCTSSLERVRRREAPSVLRSYAATNPSEFFAVATEVFFTRPVALREEDGQLYQVLRNYFRQDPAARPHVE